MTARNTNAPRGDGGAVHESNRRRTNGQPQHSTPQRLADRIRTNFPPELLEQTNWVNWRFDLVKGKQTKVPYNARGFQKASTANSKTWSTFEQAAATYSLQEREGVGYVFAGDGVTGIDLDKCRDPETGMVAEWARAIVRRFDTYTEISPSGAGLHLYVAAAVSGSGRKRPYADGAIEAYDRARYFTVTGDHLEGTPHEVRACQDELDAFMGEIFPTDDAPAIDRPSQPLAISDEELLERARSARNGARFSALYDDGDMSDYDNDASRADQALCYHLAFWTGRDAPRMNRLFRRSHLMRDKWDRADYRETAIAKAISGTAECYTPRGSSRAAKVTPIRRDAPAEDDQEPAPAIRGFTLSEMGNAERLIAAHGDEILYCYDFHKWLAWDGRRWATDNAGRVHRLAKQTVKAIYGEAEDIIDDKERRALASHALRSESAKAITGMLTHAQSDRPVTPDELDSEATDWLLNCANGTLDLRTGARRDADPADRITRRSPASYDAKATCPTWLAFLDRVMGGDQELVTFLQRAIGYSLTGSSREHVMFILYGAGMNGKTTFLDTIAAVLGDYASIAAPSTFMVKHGDGVPNDLAALKGARFVSAAETGDGQRLDEPLIKRATSEVLTARFMRGEYFDIRPTLKVWLATNHKPVIRGTDYAIWRRIRLIPFTVTIDKPDKEMARKLRAEAAGILAWAVRGCLDWQREGLSEAQAVTIATATYRAEMDTLAAFIDEVCVSGPGYKVSAAQLYSAYEAWAKANGEQHIQSQRKLGMALTERGYVRAKGFGPTGAGGWHGIGLRSPDPSDPSDPDSSINLTRDETGSLYQNQGQLGQLGQLADSSLPSSADVQVTERLRPTKPPPCKANPHDVCRRDYTSDPSRCRNCHEVIPDAEIA